MHISVTSVSSTNIVLKWKSLAGVVQIAQHSVCRSGFQPQGHSAFVLGAAHPAGAGLEAAALCSLQSSRAPGLALAEPKHFCPLCFSLLETSG